LVRWGPCNAERGSPVVVVALHCVGLVIGTIEGRRIDVEQAGEGRRPDGVDRQTEVLITNSERERERFVHSPAVLPEVSLPEQLGIVRGTSEVAPRASTRTAEIIDEVCEVGEASS